MPARRRSSTAAPGACPVVGIGASAGGVDALSKFLDHLPPNTGAAFVLLLHSDPNRKSYAVELYSRHTPMAVVEAADGMVLQPDQVYVAPAGADLVVEAGQLRTLPGAPDRGHSIDPFLISLAAERRENAVAVILSGSGSDGTQGIRAVKEHGGITMAQCEGSAQHFGMPGSAIATGMVDVALPVEELASRLARILRFELPSIHDDGTSDAQDPALARILALLNERTGHDFVLYKQGTVGRRVRRRMQLLEIPTLVGYLAHLLEHGDELDRLDADLLIGVTRFFRDPEAFDSLASLALGPILDAKDGDQTLKIWVVGCSTGEEAYSIAILVAEELERRRRTLRVQIFATDLDPAHLAIARAGVFPAAIEASVSKERLDRFFTRRDGGYQIVKSIREMLVFSVHNVLRDPPFSRLDLISCRNVLIYFRAELQQHVHPLFHHALRDDGFLFLGPSESIAGFAELYTAVDAKHRIFQRKPGTARSGPLLPFSRSERPATAFSPRAGAVVPVHKGLFDDAERTLLESYAPAAVVIDAQANVLRFLGRTGRYLEPPPGAPEMNLFSMARRGLRTALRRALHVARQNRKTTVVSNVRVGTNGGTQTIDLSVRPLNESAPEQERWLVVFQDVGAEVAPAQTTPDADRSSSVVSDDPMIQQLETELRQTRDELRSSIEDLEMSNEELRSANEEYQSVNEELQSTVEELETSKEEVQSINEELTTANAELLSKVDQLAAAKSDIKSLLESTQIPTILLDADLRIRAFTAAAQSIFTLIPSDAGRPITDLQLRIGYDRLPDDARTVIRTRTPVLRDARAADGRFYNISITPYSAADTTVTGAVATFIDVTGPMKAAEEARLLATVFRDSSDAIWVVNLDGRILHWNDGAERMYGYSEDEAKAMEILRIIPESHRAEARATIERLTRGEAINPYESRRVAKNGRMLDVRLTATPLLDDSGKIVAIAQTEQDVTERKRAEEAICAELASRISAENALRESRERLSVVIRTAAEGIITIDGRGIINSFNPAAEDMFGYAAEEVLGKSVRMLMPSLVNGEQDDPFADRPGTGVGRIIGIPREITGLHKSGTSIPLEIIVGRGTNDDGPVFVGMVRDLTARRESEARLRAAERLTAIGTLAAGLGHDMNNVLLPLRAHLSAMQTQTTLDSARGHADQIGKGVTYLQQLADGLHYLAVDPETGGDDSGGGDATDLRQWWSQVGALLSSGVPEHVRVRASFPVGLPRVAVAAHRLTQAVLNLVVNAGEAIPRPSGRKRRKGSIRIWARADPTTSTVRLGVSDNGRGMPEEVKRRAFEMFFTTKARGLGTGLGLALVDRVAIGAGGRVEVESEIGKGATIVMVLKTAEPKAAGTTGPIAVVTVGDGRSAALIRQVLKAQGARVGGRVGRSRAEIWVIDPAVTALREAQAWRASQPRGRLVLFGAPEASSSKAWRALGPVTIERRDDFESLRAAVEAVLATE